MENVRIIIINLKCDISSNGEIYLDHTTLKLYRSGDFGTIYGKLHYSHSRLRFRIVTFDAFVSLGEFRASNDGESEQGYYRRNMEPFPARISNNQILLRKSD